MKIYEVWAATRTGQVWPYDTDYCCIERYADKDKAELHAKNCRGSVKEVEVK